MALRAVCRKHPTNFIGFNRQPVAYSFILHNCVFFMARACGLELGAWILHRQAWRLKRLAIDRDPWAMLGPAVAHDLEL